jgi:hypothetical protein
MEDLQSYLFENSEDFSEKHYINLMALLLKAHNERQVRTVYVQREHIDYQQERINFITERFNINRVIIISSAYWNNELKDIINASHHVYEFICKLKYSNGDSIDNWEPTHYILPDCVTCAQRKEIHIMGSRRSDFTTFTKRGEHNDTLNVFIF